MRLVVDTNIVFSTLLNPRSSIGEILMNVQDEFTFFAPELLKKEISRYIPKIIVYSKLPEEELFLIKEAVMAAITLISEDIIDESSWQQAYTLAKDIDEDDTPFLALAIDLNCKLWTGDKELSRGLAGKGSSIILTTGELQKHLNK